MKKQRMFRPRLTDVLEDRLVLSTASAHIAAVTPTFQAANLAAIGVQINEAFASFQLDYSQAQAGYLSAAATSPTAANTDLQNFVSTRVGTLIQQINGYVASLPGTTSALSAM